MFSNITYSKLHQSLKKRVNGSDIITGGFEMPSSLVKITMQQHTYTSWDIYNYFHINRVFFYQYVCLIEWLLIFFCKWFFFFVNGLTWRSSGQLKFCTCWCSKLSFMYTTFRELKKYLERKHYKMNI